MKIAAGLLLIVVGILCLLFVPTFPVNVFSGLIFVLLGTVLLASQEKNEEKGRK